jgi:hypothetical protein
VSATGDTFGSVALLLEELERVDFVAGSLLHVHSVMFWQVDEGGALTHGVCLEGSTLARTRTEMSLGLNQEPLPFGHEGVSKRRFSFGDRKLVWPLEARSGVSLGIESCVASCECPRQDSNLHDTRLLRPQPLPI